MAGEWRPVGISDDARGNRWGIGVSGTRVVIVTAGSLHLDAAHREQFMRAFMEAERGAEAGE